MHPVSHIIVNVFHHHLEGLYFHIEPINAYRLVVESFSLDMLPMALIFVSIFGIFGFIIGRQKEKLERDLLIIQSEQHRREEMRNEFDAFVRHEMTNLVTPIVGFANILLRDEYKNLNDEQKHDLSIILNASGSISRMNDMFREVGEYEEGRFKLNKVIYKMTDIIQYSLGMVKILSDKYEVTIQTVNQIENQQVCVDYFKINSVFENLIKNAIEHVQRLENRTVGVKYYNRGGKVVVDINNGGEPIPKERLQIFFEKFNTFGKKGGTGLGTTLAHHITKAHGGDIYVKSNREEGTTVTVELPCISEQTDEVHSCMNYIEENNTVK